MTALVVGRRLPCRPAPGFFDNLSFTDVLRGDRGRLVIGTRKDEFVAQVEHEDVCVAPVERAVKGGLGDF